MYLKDQENADFIELKTWLVRLGMQKSFTLRACRYLSAVISYSVCQVPEHHRLLNASVTQALIGPSKFNSNCKLFLRNRTPVSGF